MSPLSEPLRGRPNLNRRIPAGILGVLFVAGGVGATLNGNVVGLFRIEGVGRGASVPG